LKKPEAAVYIPPTPGEVKNLRRKSFDLNDDIEVLAKNYKNSQSSCGVTMCKIFSFGKKK
jgi:hypothetical protein